MEVFGGNACQPVKSYYCCSMVRRWRIFGDFLRPVLSASRVQHISDMHSKFALSPLVCGSMVDIR